MPWRPTKYGKECPLGVFKADIPSGGGSYTSDPLEGCLGNEEYGIPCCNYFRHPEKGEKLDLEKNCMCPADMTKEDSRKLKQEYAQLIQRGEAEKTKRGFWEFVNKKHK